MELNSTQPALSIGVISMLLMGVGGPMRDGHHDSDAQIVDQSPGGQPNSSSRWSADYGTVLGKIVIDGNEVSALVASNSIMSPLGFFSAICNGQFERYRPYESIFVDSSTACPSCITHKKYLYQVIALLNHARSSAKGCKFAI